MPYAILPEDESVESAVRRIAREEAEGALAAVRGDGELGPRVHEMRKVVKKLRGLLRLVRPVLPPAAAENATLRDAGRSLADLRDAAVLLATVEPLARDMDESHRARLLAPVREATRQHDARAAEEMLPAFAETMSDLLDRSQGWRLKRDGWEALEPGLQATWAAARRTMRAARRDPQPDHLHEWRKRTKDHWYQARLLQPIWPEMMKPHVQAADDLGEVLGQVNDLAVLRHRLAGADLEPAIRSEAQDLATVRHAELLAQAMPLGRRLFAGEAEALTARWRGWWKLRAA
jgi:CHAD domain-containing protein